METCSICEFAYQQRGIYGVEILCRRYPPTKEEHRAATYPSILADWWCGEWRKKKIRE